MIDPGAILIYTVCRAVGAEKVRRAFDSIRQGQKTAGAPHDWILWANSPDVLEAARLGWAGITMGTGENVGQHIPLRAVLDYTRCNNPLGERHGGVLLTDPNKPHNASCIPRSYQYLVRVDDDIEWVTRDWLYALVEAHEAILAYSGKRAVVSASVLGLLHPINKISIRIDKLRLDAVPILGGACRLHHLSFFDGYEPDVRWAMGAGDATSIAQHAENTHIPLFAIPRVRVRHDTRKHIERDPLYFVEHDVLQHIPYIPSWHPTEEAPLGDMVEPAAHKEDGLVDGR